MYMYNYLTNKNIMLILCWTNYKMLQINSLIFCARALCEEYLNLLGSYVHVF